MKVGILTGGGDCPGLNAVIRAVVRRAATRIGSRSLEFAMAGKGSWSPRAESSR